MFSAASDSVMLCATVNAVTTSDQLPERSAEQQQPDQKQQVVGADQDVVHARRHEPLDDGEDALPRFPRNTRTACGTRRGSPAR